MSLTPAKLVEVISAPAELDDEPSNELKIGIFVAVAFFVVFLGWATFAPMDAAAYAEGQVRVSSYRQVIQHREGGTVGKLYVKEAQRVQKGQVLLELSGAEQQASEESLSGQAVSLKAQRARLEAEQLGLQQIVWPAEFTSPVPGTEAAVQKAMAIQQSLFTSRRNSMATQRDVLVQRTRQLAEQAEGFRRQVAATGTQEKLIGEELTGMKSLADRGFVPQTQIRSLERAQAQLGGQGGQYSAAIAQAREQTGEARLKIIELERMHKEQVATELRDVEFALNEMLPKLTAAEDQLARTSIRAPASGVVVGLSVHTVGSVIQPGQKVADIVPEQTPMVIEARVSPNDADDLQIDQEAQIRFTGIHERRMPTLKGKVSKVSADSFTDEKSGMSYFITEVTVPPSQLAEIQKMRGKNFALKPGMPVQVIVPLRKRTALEYALEPLSATLWRSFREH